ncbi:MAG: ABC transporter permease [Candidatus Nanopelagicales bacterium]
MTATLERPPSPHAAAPVPSRPARWWGAWRVALRLARRDAWRGKGRALLVVLLVALPVATVSGILVYDKAERVSQSFTVQGLRSLGPTAEARVLLGPGPVVQSPALSTSESSESGRVATAADVRGALPAGARAVSTGTATSVVLEAGPWGIQSGLAVQDVADPLLAGLWSVAEGRLPQSTSEVALDVRDLRRLQAGIGSTVAATTTNGERAARDLTVVGALDSTYSYSGGVVLPGALPGDPGATKDQELLVDAPTPITWSDVRRLNALGATVVSRAVLESPPAFCDPERLCLDDREQPEATDTKLTQLQVEEAARIVALGAVVLVLVVLQVALLAGPAFAVQLRRRQRELGLVGASGGDAAALRRTVLASGVVLGVVGAVAGVALGWLAVWLVGVPLAGLDWVRQGGIPQGVPPLPPYVLGVALVGVISAVTAALIPAVVAGRGDVIDTLRGRRPLPPVRTRTPLVGLLLGVVGVGLLLYGRSAGGLTNDPLILGAGIIAGELGLVLVMPWLVVQLGRVGRFLPLTPRLAVRDAGRHRLRTATAACAIAAAAAAAVATSTWSTSQRLQVDASGVPYVAGALPVTFSPSFDAAVRGATAADVRRAVDAAAPGSSTITVLNVIPRDQDPKAAEAGGYGGLSCVQPDGATPPTTADAAGMLGPCGFRPATEDGQADTVYYSAGLSTPVSMIEDPDDLGRLLGPLARTDEAVATLKAGGAVSLVPDSLDGSGRVWLRPSTMSLAADGSVTEELDAVVAIPAVEVTTGTMPAQVLVGPAALAPGAPLGRVATSMPGAGVVVVEPVVADRPDRPTLSDTLSIALAKSRVSASVITMSDLQREDSTGVVLAVAAAATLGMALLAGLMVTALALADGRADLVTLAAVGAEPKVRRRMAASTAGFVSALGCAAGVVSGLVVAKLLVGLFYSVGGRAFEVNWPLVAFVLLAIPLVTAGVAWLTTRSKVVIPRRTDS